MKTRNQITLICIGLVAASAFMVTVYSYPESFGLTKPYTRVGPYDGASHPQALLIDEQCAEIEKNPFADYGFTSYSNGAYYIDNVICERINVEQGGCLEPFSKGYPDETCKNRVTYEFPYGETKPQFNREFCNRMTADPPILNDTVEYKELYKQWMNICKIRGFVETDEKHSESKVTIDNLLLQNGIEYLPDKLVVTGGPRFSGDPGCGAVIDTDLQTHWFAIDSVSKPTEMTLFSENPHSCEVNTVSCFCNAQMELTTLTLDKLSYFSSEDEKKFAHILIDYLKNNNVNVTPKFQIGKLNLNFTDPDAIGYCGELWGDNRNDFFSGAIVNGYVKDYGLDKELPLLCAISENAKWWENEN